MSKFLIGLVIVSLVGFTLVIYLQLDAPVERVTVAGLLDDAERAQIRGVVRQLIDGGLLSADLEALQAGILALSWPRSVTIRRAWPDKLTIEVEKTMVVARWQDGFLAGNGNVVRLPVVPAGLPRFDCQISEPRVAMEVFQLLNGAGTDFGLEIVQLQENELGEWSVSLRETGRVDELVLRLGAESIAERFGRFLVVYGQRLRERESPIDLIDARYDNGIAVDWGVDDSTLLAASPSPESVPAQIVGLVPDLKGNL